jgi:O-antigen ligase
VYLAGGVSGRWTEFGRMAAFGGGANVFARIMGTGLLAIAYLWSRTGRNAWLWAAPLLAYGAVMSGSRGGLLALALAGSMYIVHLGRHARLRARALWPVAVMTLALFVVRGPAIVSFWMTRFVELTLEQRYLTQRDQLFGAAVELFRGHAAFGAGLESYRATVGWVYPHNLILHIAAEQGAAGLTLLSVAALLFGWRLRRGALPSQRAALAVAGLYFAASMFSGGIYDARFVWLFTALYMIEPTARDSTPVLRG